MNSKKIDSRIAAVMHNVRQLPALAVACGAESARVATMERRIEDGLRELVGLPAVQPELPIEQSQEASA